MLKERIQINEIKKIFTNKEKNQNISTNYIEKKTYFKEPKHISFEYEFSNKTKELFNVDCYIILF